ncbi:hypothetical protein [Mycobacterium tilburgii]|nr:hypothetical protein [Mycobacterium tilburgii]
MARIEVEVTRPVRVLFLQDGITKHIWPTTTAPSPTPCCRICTTAR